MDPARGVDAARALVAEGEVLLARGQGEAALAAFLQAAEAAGRLVAPRLGRGRALLALGRYAEAMVAFREVLDLSPGDARAHDGLAQAHAKQGDYGEAVRELRRAAREPPRGSHDP